MSVPKPETKQVNIPIQYRVARIEESSINEQERTVEIVWTTGARRVTFSWEEWGMVEEELDLAGADLSRLNNGAPFLKDHAAWSIDNVLGVHVDGSVVIDAVAKVGRAKIRFDTDPECDKYFKKVVNRILRQTSVGYGVGKYVVTREEGRLPLYRAVEWTPYENSLVTIGADPGAQVQRAEDKPKLFGCRIEFRTANQPKEKTMGAKNNPKIPNQNRAMTDDVKAKCRDILKEAGVAEDKLDECTDKLSALWPEETKEGGSGEMSAIAKELGCKDNATPKEVAQAAKNLRALCDSLESQLEESETLGEFEANEAKGLHRELNKVSKDFARELFDSNPVLYRSKVGKVKPLTEKSPEARPETRKTLEKHEALTQDEKFSKEVEAEEKRLMELNPKLTSRDAYRQAFNTVKARHNVVAPA